MTLDEAKRGLEKFVKLKTTLRPAFVDVLLNAEEVKHGHWTYERLTNTNGGSYSVVCCSNCQARIPWVTKYCPCCGAKMDEVEDGNT